MQVAGKSTLLPVTLVLGMLTPACRKAEAPLAAPEAGLAPVVLDAAVAVAPPDGSAVAEGGASAEPAPPDPREELTSRTYDVLLNGSVVYRATTAGVVIEDAAEPEKPARLGTLFLPGSVNALAWIGPVQRTAATACPSLPDGASGCPAAGPVVVLAAAAGPAGVYLIDVTDPAHPVELSRLDTDGAAMGLAAAFPLLWVADGSNGVLAVDVADPAQPRIAGGAFGAAFNAAGAGPHVESNVPPPENAVQPSALYVRGVAVVGNRLFAAAGFAGLYVYEIRDPLRASGPLALVPLVSVDTPGDARAVAPDGDTVFVADGTAGLQVIDVGLGGPDPEPSIVATYATRDVCRDVKLDVSRDRSLFPPAAYLAVGDGGLEVLDISAATAPKLVGSFVPVRPVNRVTVGPNGLLLLANDSAGLLIVDAGDPAAVRRVFPPTP
jgi:hypothetical protein